MNNSTCIQYFKKSVCNRTCEYQISVVAILDFDLQQILLDFCEGHPTFIHYFNKLSTVKLCLAKMVTYSQKRDSSSNHFYKNCFIIAFLAHFFCWSMVEFFVNISNCMYYIYIQIILNESWDVANASYTYQYLTSLAHVKYNLYC